MSEVYGALEGALDFVSNLWNDFMGFDSETLLLVGIVIGFVIAMTLGFTAQRIKTESRSKHPERKIAGSVGQSQNMCA